MKPHFEYACNAWYRSVNAKVKHKLQTPQNKMIRYFLNYGCRRHIGFSDFKKSHCLAINARVDYVTLNLMFNICNNVALSYMCDISRISYRHNRRQSDSAYVLSYVYSKQPIFWLTQEWFRELYCVVHDKLHISSVDWWDLYFPWHRHQIEGTNGF